MRRWLFPAALALAALVSGAVAIAEQIVGPTLGNQQFPAQVTPWGGLLVDRQPVQTLWDDFGTGTLDTTNNWAAPTTGGGGNATAATNAVGQTTLGSGTTSGGWSLLQSRRSFRGRNPGWIESKEHINIESPVVLNTYRFWGFATVPGSPTCAAPVTDGEGFEINTDGKLRAVTFASGGRTVIQDLSAASPFTGPVPPQPADANVHAYITWFRGDRIFWTLDGDYRKVAEILTGALGPDVNTVPLTHLAIACAGATATATIKINQSNVADTSGLAVSTLPVVCGSAVSSCVIATTPRDFIDGYATCTAACWIMLFNATAAPSNGATTAGIASGNMVDCIQLSAAGTASLAANGSPPIYFANGIVVAISSTACATLTLSTVGFVKGRSQ